MKPVLVSNCGSRTVVLNRSALGSLCGDSCRTFGHHKK